MPRGDRTGQNGIGPMAGRADGYCSGYEIPRFMNPMGGRGMGGGRGFGNPYLTSTAAVATPEKDMLTPPPQSQAPMETAPGTFEQLTQEFQSIVQSFERLYKRIDTLENTGSSDCDAIQPNNTVIRIDSLDTCL